VISIERARLHHHGIMGCDLCRSILDWEQLVSIGKCFDEIGDIRGFGVCKPL
jgi:hypothetical protein